VLQDRDKLDYIMKDGRFHKEAADQPAPAPPNPGSIDHNGTAPANTWSANA
jgi:hypothetical protein